MAVEILFQGPFESPGEEEERKKRDLSPKNVPPLTAPFLAGFIWDLFVVFGSMLLYFMDSASDIYVAWGYYVSGYMTYFVLTLTFVLLPGIVVAGFSVLLYILDTDESKQPNPTRTSLPWIIMCTLLSGLQLGPIIRDVETLVYKWGVMDAMLRQNLPDYRYNDKYSRKEEADAAFLRLFERFMEDAPQVTLQLFVFFHHFQDPNFKFATNTLFVTILLSFISLAVAITSLNRTARSSQDNKENISAGGWILQFFWHTCIIISRVFALALFASAYPAAIVPVCLVHWLLMFLWLLYQERVQERLRGDLGPSPALQRSSCCSQVYSSFPRAIFAFIHLFVYFNTVDAPTRNKYWLFYGFCLAENLIFVFSSLYVPHHSKFQWVGFSSFALFGIGILLMWIYYRWCHPSRVFKSTKSAIKYMVFQQTVSVPKTVP